MLTFKNTSFSFITLFIALIIYDVYNPVSFILYSSLLLLYSLALFYGSYFVHSNFYMHVICAANTNKKNIAISFDDGPANKWTAKILDILKKENIQAAFFCIGSQIKGNESLLKRLQNEGHIIGNHSYSHHFWFSMFSSKKMLEDINAMNAAVKNITGLNLKLFRPPYGVTNPNVKKAVMRGGYTPVGWSVRSMDTVIHDEKKLLEKVTRSLKPGAVFLFHDTSETTLKILPIFIKHTLNEGYNIQRLDTLLNIHPYA